MKRFLAVYRGTAAAMEKWHSLDEKTRKEREAQGMQAWHNWVATNSKVIKDTGSPLGKTKRIDRHGISDTKNALTAYVIVEAESHEEAAKLFLQHPHFSIFPGDSVEIMECLPIPQR